MVSAFWVNGGVAGWEITDGVVGCEAVDGGVVGPETGDGVVGLEILLSFIIVLSHRGHENEYKIFLIEYISYI